MVHDFIVVRPANVNDFLPVIMRNPKRSKKGPLNTGSSELDKLYLSRHVTKGLDPNLMFFFKSCFLRLKNSRRKTQK